MPAIVIVGAQWGDEGKGKATDLLGDSVDYVVRYQGGNNAGHTVVIGEESYALHLLPSGVLSEHAIPVIGNGVVIDPAVLIAEIEGIEARGVSCGRLLISANAHLVMPHHVALDKVTERYLGNARIGTTGRGIGPSYADKASRVGIRVQDLFDKTILRQKLELVLREKNQVLTKLYNRRGVDAQAVCEEYTGYGKRLARYIADTGLVLNQALDDGKVVLLEGAQATLLDVDHGTYPFVTSSSATAGGACIGAGVGPNGITDYFITKLDVLSGLGKVPVCVGYEVDGVVHGEVPMTQTDFHHAKPVFEYLDGWWEDISRARELSDLPANARAYVLALQDMIGAPIAAVGVGPRRNQTLRLRELI